MKKILMARGADKVVSTCVKVKPGEKVLIITEASRLSIAEACRSRIPGPGRAHPAGHGPP